MKIKNFEKIINICALLPFLASFPIRFAQKTKLDSLQNILEIHNERNNTKVNLLNTFAYKIRGKGQVEGLRTLVKARVHSDETRYKKRLSDNLNSKEATYYKQSDFKKVYDYQILFKTLNDSVFKKMTVEKITRLEYEYKKRLDSVIERENNLKAEVNTIDTQLEATKQQKLWWIIGFFSLLVLLIFLYRNHRCKQLKTESENTNLRFQALNMEMNPHFIYNSLSSIQQYVLRNDSTIAQQYLAQFSVLIRAILFACKKDVIPLKNELDIIKSYVELEKKRFNDTFNFEIINNVENSFEIYLPPLLIQPLVENAIIHGVSTLKDRKGFISISFNLINKELECVVKDNGIGIETSIKEKEQRIITHESVALKNIEERLKLLDKKNTQRLSIRSSNNTLYSTETRILIPLLV